MAERRWKPIIFTAIGVLAFTIVLFIFLHRSNQRQRLCPNSQDLLYTDPNLNESTCYPEHSQDPCPNNMVLYEKPGNQSLGVCDCDFIHNDRGLVYNKEWNKCFFIFSQGYCKPNQWLIPYKDGTCSENLCAKCEPNLCSNKNSNPLGSELVQLKDGSCQELGSLCPDGSTRLHFVKYKAYPTCEERKHFTFSTSGIGVPPTRCRPGYSKTSLGHCAPDFDFE